MSLYPRFRDIHLYVGLAILVPVGIISATGILLNHEHSLGLKPQHDKRHGKSDRGPEDIVEFRSSPGTHQLYALAFEEALASAADQWGGPQPLERVELKREPGVGMVIKVKAHREANVEPEEMIWSVAERKLIPHPDEDPKTAGLGGVHWNKVIKDLHTGKIFSKSYGFWWSDASAASILILSLTGIVLYTIPLLKKAAKKRRAVAAAPATMVSERARPLPVSKSAT